jgi:hypothetical protein
MEKEMGKERVLPSLSLSLPLSLSSESGREGWERRGKWERRMGKKRGRERASADSQAA